ncbi:N-acetylmuramate alpha-1-phosphate uridylyltransferase MurU [Massilia sp. TS11]|uniref:N-acetylmuramate alpha-1-phosphate uridylyltransferase MurU n=1 Tax=Massilia sp. TS11 TaxID=2908003 RepID=UPI001ED9F393|nr:nucleotidyltransferase family protein [Massilia sp. TS11]MCG2586717.1 nucleotidyltransferase family protein [Massilia sp. TS11]
MKAMLLAAGRGERMRPLTDSLPKPLLTVRGRPLIVWHILNLVRAGITEIVINHAHLGHLIEQALGDGSQFGARIAYSPEDPALETGGGIAQALPLLGPEPFLAVSADIYCPYFDFADTLDVLKDTDVLGNPIPPEQRDMAWIYLTKNPWHNPHGDFGLTLYQVSNTGEPKWNFANIGVYRPEMFADIVPGTHARMGPVIRAWAERGRVGGELIDTDWTNVGTIAQLEALNAPYGGRGQA